MLLFLKTQNWNQDFLLKKRLKTQPYGLLTWWNPAKPYKEKAPKNGQDKETNLKDESPGQQTAQKRRATQRKGNH